MIQNNQRLDQIRELLSAHPQGLSVTEIAAALGVNKNSTGRSLDTLFAAGEIRMRRFGMAKLYTSAARMPLSAMMSLPSDLILITDADQIIIFINDPFLALLGLNRDQVINRHITAVRGIAPDIERLEAAFAAAADEGERKEMIWFNEEERVFLRRCVQVTLESGAAGTAVIMEELTAQVRAEEALHDRESQLAEIIENLQDCYYRSNRQDTLVTVTRPALSLLGYDSVDQLLGRPVASFWAEPEKRKKFVHLVQKRGAINDFETNLVRADGSLVPVSISSHLRLAEDGEVQGLGGTIRDISRRKENEERIRVLSAHNRAMIEANLDPIAAIDRDGIITDVNAATEAITGFPRDNLIGTRFSQYYADQHLAEQVFGEVFYAGQVRNRHVEVLHLDGHKTPALLNATLCRDEDGTITGIFASFRDITSQQQMDLDLIRSEGRLQMMAAVFVNAAQPIAIGYPDGGCAYANPAICRLFGYSEKKLKTLNWFSDLTPREWREEEAQALDRLTLTGEPQRYRKEYLHRDGHRVPVEVVAHLVHETGDLPLSLCLFVTDISRNLRAEEERAACELRLDHLVTSAPLGIWMADDQGRVLTANPLLTGMLGLSPADLVGRLDIEVLAHAGLDEANAPRGMLTTGVTDQPVIVRRTDGGVTEGLLTTAPIPDRRGKRQGMVGFLVDRAQEMRQERLLTEVTRRFTAAIDQAPLMALQFDGAGGLISCNDSLVARTGWTRNQVLGTEWHRYLVPGEGTEGEPTLFDAVSGRGSRRDWTGPVPTADGRTLQVRWTCLAHRDDRDHYAGLTCLGEDITDRHRLAGLIVGAEEQYRNLVETVPFPTVLIDGDWTVTRANRIFSNTFGYRVPAPPKKLTLLSIVTPESRPAVTALLNPKEAGQGTCTMVGEDGAPIRATILPGPCSGDGPRVIVLIADDVPGQI